jgi:hypothetical protein
MKIVHWTFLNGSGLHRMAEDISNGERKLGHDSMLIDTRGPEINDVEVEADVHVLHSHIPDHIINKCKKLVYVVHGTPEHSFQSSVEAGLNQGYGAGDSFMMLMHYMQIADVTTVWWPRHKAIYDTMCDKNTRVEVVPMGIDLDVWKPMESRGKWAGEPSVLTAENCHYIKWPLDLFILWPWIVKEIPSAVLHAAYLPRDQHRWFMPLVMRNGAAYKMYISGDPLAQPELINALCSTDFYIGLVRYGDFDRLTMEAKACGAKLISYAGNEYADYWITEGDQRIMAQELLAIMRGETEPRTPLPVNSIDTTVAKIVEIYESLG